METGWFFFGFWGWGNRGRCSRDVVFVALGSFVRFARPFFRLVFSVRGVGWVWWWAIVGAPGVVKPALAFFGIPVADVFAIAGF